MDSIKLMVGATLALALMAGCDSNPDGPRAPSVDLPKGPAKDTVVRPPITKNPREIANPD